MVRILVIEIALMHPQNYIQTNMVVTFLLAQGEMSTSAASSMPGGTSIPSQELPDASHELDGESMADDELMALEREADAAVLARVEKESLGGGGATMSTPAKHLQPWSTPAKHLQP